MTRFLDCNLGAYGSLKMILRSETSGARSGSEWRRDYKDIKGEETFLSSRVFDSKSVLLL